MAFLQKATDNKTDTAGYQQTSFTPFSAAIKRTEAIVQKDGKQFKVMKGAYNTIKSLCNLQQSKLDKTVDGWAAKGFKTIAVAIQRGNITSMVGIVALVDPPLSDSAKMIREIKELGVTVKMLTGDALPIAKEIATQVGVGDDIAAASLLRQHKTGSDSHSIIIDHNGFAEVLPEDKFTIVKTLQQHHEITGMTGDGVNDAPALKQALVKQGFILGMLLIVEALLWLIIGKKYFEITDINQLHSFGFASLFFASIFNIFVVRTPTRFYKQPIGKNLLIAIIADIVFACIILSIGLPGFTTLPLIVTGSSLLYFALCSLTINDWVKVKVNS